jgi:hypothetical protein
VATYNTTFKLDDVRKLAEAKFEAVTVQQWQNICSHVEKIEVEYMKREYIVDEVEDLIISINGEESDESDFFLSSDEEQVDEKEVQGGRLQPFSEDTLGGGNLRGPNIPVP